ncbi:MAG: hypothetical protein IPG89_17830 [Bacteroidetes bacterium]|nr:hypothetical protein [Bacteroidota bacterium]
MFHAIRAARKYQKLSGESTTVLLFNHGYSDKQVKAFERVCKMFGVSNVVKVSNVDEVVNYINSKNTKTASLSTERQSDPVSNLDIFSHGLPGRIPLDYEGGKSNTDLTIEES